jgi:hypothetical protein
LVNRKEVTKMTAQQGNPADSFQPPLISALASRQ